VSIAAIKSFHIIVDTSPISTSEDTHTLPNSTQSTPVTPSTGSSSPQGTGIWVRAWQAWESIGKETVVNTLPSVEKLRSIVQSPKQDHHQAYLDSLPTQGFLTHLLGVFPHVFHHLRPNFTEANLKQLGLIITTALQMPVTKDVSPFLVPSSNENLMTSLHKLVIQCLAVIFTEDNVFEPLAQPSEGQLLANRKSDQIDISKTIKLNKDEELNLLYPQILSQLLNYFSYATKVSDRLGVSAGISPVKLPVMVVNMMPFSVGCLSLAVKLYRACVAHKITLPDNIPEAFLKVKYTYYNTCTFIHKCTSVYYSCTVCTSC